MLLAIENGGKNVYGINLYFSLLSLCFVLLSLDKTVHFSLTSLSVRIIKETGKKEWFVLFEIDSVCLDLSFTAIYSSSLSVSYGIPNDEADEWLRPVRVPKDGKVRGSFQTQGWCCRGIAACHIGGIVNLPSEGSRVRHPYK